MTSTDKNKRLKSDGHDFYQGNGFVVPIFPLVERHPSRLYVIASEVAKKVGLRDSYSLFSRNPSIKKQWASEKERNWLADRGILSSAIKFREIAIAELKDVFKIYTKALLKLGSNFTSKTLKTLLNQGIPLPASELLQMKEKNYIDDELFERLISDNYHQMSFESEYDEDLNEILASSYFSTGELDDDNEYIVKTPISSKKRTPATTKRPGFESGSGSDDDEENKENISYSRNKKLALDSSTPQKDSSLLGNTSKATRNNKVANSFDDSNDGFSAIHEDEENVLSTEESEQNADVDDDSPDNDDDEDKAEDKGDALDSHAILDNPNVLSGEEEEEDIIVKDDQKIDVDSATNENKLDTKPDFYFESAFEKHNSFTNKLRKSRLKNFEELQRQGLFKLTFNPYYTSLTKLNKTNYKDENFLSCTQGFSSASLSENVLT